jgi:hypothetical protein
MIRIISEWIASTRQKLSAPKQPSMEEKIDFYADNGKEYTTYRVQYGSCTLVKS